MCCGNKSVESFINKFDEQQKKVNNTSLQTQKSKKTKQQKKVQSNTTLSLFSTINQPVEKSSKIPYLHYMTYTTTKITSR
jgi:phage/plasmid primase-like uncharacterized protein